MGSPDGARHRAVLRHPRDFGMASSPARPPRKISDGEAILLREYRKGAGLTQRELADLAGVHQEVISRIETGHSAPQNNRAQRRIAAALGIDISLIAPEIEGDDGVYWQIKRSGSVTRCEPYYPDEGWATP